MIVECRAMNLAERVALYERMLETSLDSFRYVDANGQTVIQNRAAATRRFSFGGESGGDAFLNSMLLDAVREGMPFTIELPAIGEGGNERIYEVTAAPLLTEQGRFDGFVETSRDVTDRKKAEVILQENRTELSRKANYDALTGLPNRVLLKERLRHAVEVARRNRVHACIIFIDLNKFKPVNDRYGHAAGDEVLREVGKRLITVIRKTDTAARVGGDEFVVVLEHVTVAEDAMSVAEKILSAIEQPMYLMTIGGLVEIGASLGIATYPDDGDSEEMLLQLADHAMYQAKRGGRRITRFQVVRNQTVAA